MANFRCSCTNILHLTGVEDYECAIIPKKIIHDLAEEMDEKQIDGDTFFDTLNDNRKSAYICPKCNRITVDEGSRMVVYVIEEIIT